MNAREMWLLMVGERVVCTLPDGKQQTGEMVARTNEYVLFLWDDAIENVWVSMEHGENIHKQTEGSKRK